MLSFIGTKISHKDELNTFLIDILAYAFRKNTLFYVLFYSQDILLVLINTFIYRKMNEKENIPIHTIQGTT